MLLPRSLILALSLLAAPALARAGDYIIGSPIFPGLTLHFENDTPFPIRALDVSSKNISIQSTTLNGQPFEKAWIEHTAIKQGGVLELSIGAAPSSWGVPSIPSRPA